MNETETEQIYQIIFRGDRSEGWQSWKRNLAAAASGNEGVSGTVGKAQKAATNFKGGTSMTQGYRQIWCPIHPNATNVGYVLEHILVCEMALGDFLPPGAVPHHINEIKDDNRPDNLLLCESRAFHNLLHKRMRALKECGHADWLRCKICHAWSSPDDLYVMVQKGETVSYHRACIQDYKRKKREAAGRPMGAPRGARGAYGPRV